MPVILFQKGWSDGAMGLGKLPVPGRPTTWMIVGQGPIVLALGVGGGCLDIFTPLCPLSPLSPFLWETARHKLKYCLKGLLNPKQQTNQIFQKCTCQNKFRRNFSRDTDDFRYNISKKYYFQLIALTVVRGNNF